MVEVSRVVDEVEEIAGEVVGVVVEVVEALEEAPGEVQRSSSSLTDILAFSSPRAKTISLSRRTLSPEKVFMARSGYQLKAVSTTRRSSIAYGILSGASWQPVYWAVWIRFLSSLERRFCTLVQLVARVSVT